MGVGIDTKNRVVPARKGRKRGGACSIRWGRSLSSLPIEPGRCRARSRHMAPKSGAGSDPRHPQSIARRVWVGESSTSGPMSRSPLRSGGSAAIPTEESPRLDLAAEAASLPWRRSAAANESPTIPGARAPLSPSRVRASLRKRRRAPSRLVGGHGYAMRRRPGAKGDIQSVHVSPITPDHTPV